MRKFQLALGLSALLVGAQVLAEPAPVEDLGAPAELDQPAYYDSDNNGLDDQQGRLTLDQRINKLERQIQNINQNNMDSKVEQLRKQLQDMTGQLDKQQHDLKVLADQQKAFYSDLNARVNAREKKSTQQASLELMNDAAKTAVKPTVVTAKESQGYRDAFELLKAKQYDQAIGAFQKYLMEYPAGKYVVNSNYWLGEIYYLQGKPGDAKKAFTVVVTNYPNSQKMPDAMLKIAIIAIDAGDNNTGREVLEKVLKQYPGTTAARLAELRYQELKLSS